MTRLLLRLAAICLATVAAAACDRASGALPNYAMDAGAPRNGLLSREALADGDITARIKAELLADPAMTGTDVTVNTDGGVVILTGTVKSQEQAAIASAHAQRNDGVLRIDNHLSTLPQ